MSWTAYCSASDRFPAASGDGPGYRSRSPGHQSCSRQRSKAWLAFVAEDAEGVGGYIVGALDSLDRALHGTRGRGLRVSDLGRIPAERLASYEARH